MEKLKWFSTTTYFDGDTGEILSKSKVIRERWHIKECHTTTEIKTQNFKKYGIKNHAHRCEKNRQTRLEF